MAQAEGAAAQTESAPTASESPEEQPPTSPEPDAAEEALAVDAKVESPIIPRSQDTGER